MGRGAAWAQCTAVRRRRPHQVFWGKVEPLELGSGGWLLHLGPTLRFFGGGEVGSPPPDVKAVQTLKRQVPSLVDVASSTERLKKMTISAESAQPLSSALARERQAAIDEQPLDVMVKAARRTANTLYSIRRGFAGGLNGRRSRRAQNFRRSYGCDEKWRSHLMPGVENALFRWRVCLVRRPPETVKRYLNNYTLRSTRDRGVTHSLQI